MEIIIVRFKFCFVSEALSIGSKNELTFALRTNKIMCKLSKIMNIDPFLFTDAAFEHFYACNYLNI